MAYQVNLRRISWVNIGALTGCATYFNETWLKCISVVSHTKLKQSINIENINDIPIS